jgi:hypothetical protein
VRLAGLYALERLAYSTWMTEVDTEVPPTEAEGGLGHEASPWPALRLVIRQRNSALAGDLFVNAVGATGCAGFNYMPIGRSLSPQLGMFSPV